MSLKYSQCLITSSVLVHIYKCIFYNVITYNSYLYKTLSIPKIKTTDILRNFIMYQGCFNKKYSVFVIYVSREHHIWFYKWKQKHIHFTKISTRYKMFVSSTFVNMWRFSPLTSGYTVVVRRHRSINIQTNVTNCIYFCLPFFLNRPLSVLVHLHPK